MDTVRKRSRSLVSSDSEDSVGSDTLLTTESPPQIRIVQADPGPNPTTDSTGTKAMKSVRPASSPTVARCTLPGHFPARFTSYEHFENHYRKAHLNRCLECDKNFPDEHFLDLHIAENHDPIQRLRMERGEKTFRCILSTCDRVCSTAEKRRLHCIDKHMFHRNYNFLVVDRGITKFSMSMLVRHPARCNSTTTSTSMAESDARSEHYEDGGEDEDQGDVLDEEGHEAEVEENNGEDEEHKKSTHLTPRPKPTRPFTGFLPFPPRQLRGWDRGDNRGRYSRSGRGARFNSSGRDSVSDIMSSMSALQFIPHSVMLKKAQAKVAGTKAAGTKAALESE